MDTVTKGFTDTLLATVGFIVLAILAALVEQKSQGFIFTVGVVVYAVYLIIFQIGYRMGSIWPSLSIAKSGNFRPFVGL